MKNIVLVFCLVSLSVGCRDLDSSDRTDKEARGAQSEKLPSGRLGSKQKVRKPTREVEPVADAEKERSENPAVSGPSPTPSALPPSTLGEKDLSEIRSLLRSQVSIENRCGGTVVSSKVILTSASCLDSLSKSLLPGFAVEAKGGITAKTVKVHIPANFALSGTDTLGLDVAILELENSLPEAYVAPVLEEPEVIGIDDFLALNSGLVVFESLSEKIKIIPFVSEFGMPKDPKTFEHIKKRSESNRLTNLEFLGGFGSRNPCEGQGGSGAFVKKNGQWKLAGITSRALNRNGIGLTRCDSEAISTIFTSSFAAKSFLDSSNIGIDALELKK